MYFKHHEYCTTVCPKSGVNQIWQIKFLNEFLVNLKSQIFLKSKGSGLRLFFLHFIQPKCINGNLTTKLINKRVDFNFLSSTFLT